MLMNCAQRKGVGKVACISTKELNYMKDFLSWELYLAKACHDHATQASDSNCARLLDEAGRMHQQNYVDLFNYLEQIK